MKKSVDGRRSTKKKDMSLKGKNLGLRTISGAIMGVIVIGAVLWGAWPTAIMASLICVGAMTELVELATKRLPEVWPPYILILCFGVAWITGVTLNPSPLMVLVGLMFVPFIFVWEIFRKNTSPLINTAIASLMLLLPDPFGPITAVIPLSKEILVLSGNDLKP